MRAAIGHLTFDAERCIAAVSDGSTQATDIAEALVRKGIPFREAYKATGQLVHLARRQRPALGLGEDRFRHGERALLRLQHAQRVVADDLGLGQRLLLAARQLGVPAPPSPDQQDHAGQADGAGAQQAEHAARAEAKRRRHASAPRDVPRGKVRVWRPHQSELQPMQEWRRAGRAPQ